MFFFSAATYNGHRIHYDKQWARDVEGYDDVLVQGPLQSALLARAVTDWIGGRGRLVEYSVQNRAVAHPGQQLTFGGVVTAKRLSGRRRAGGPGHHRPTRRHRADAGHGDRRPAAARRGALMGLRGEAAIIGIAELPAQRKQTRPELVHPRPVRAAGEMVIEDAGLDAAVVNGLICHGIAESDMFAPATLSEYLGMPMDFGERVDLGGATSAGMVWRAAVAVELGLCDAVLAVVPGSTMLPQSQRQPPPAPAWYGASSNRFGSPQAEYEIPYGNVGQNAPYAQIAQRYARAVRLRPSRAGQDRRRPAHQRLRASRRGVPRQAADRRRRAGQPDDRRPDPHAGDRDARAGRRGRADRQRRHRAPLAASPGVGQGIRRAHRLQDTHLRRRSDDHPGRAVLGAGVRDGRADPVRRRRRLDLRLLHHHRADEPGGRRVLRQG